MRKPRVLSRVFMALVFIFLYAPIFVLMIFSFNNSNSRTVWNGFTFKWYNELFHDSMIINSFTTTISVSILAALAATVLGTLAALGLYTMKRRWRGPILAVNNIPLMNADIVTGVSLCLLFVIASRIFDFNLGFGSLLIAHITFNVPYVILSVMPKLYQMDKNLIDAAADLGCKPTQTFFKVIVPEIKSGVVNGALIAFTMSIDDFMISYFTAGSTVQTLAMTIYSMTKKRITPEINAISSILFLTVLILLIIVNVRQEKDLGDARKPRIRALKKETVN